MARLMAPAWPKAIVEWAEGDTAYLSVPFTWLLPELFSRCVWWQSQGLKVWVGGPAVDLRPDYPGIRSVAEVGGSLDALPHHNPNATFTSRGCIRQCSFCAVPIIEGGLVELQEWERKPIVCDNNLLACTRRHFDRVIDSLKGLHGVDFNQGLDARLLTDYHAARIAELDMLAVRLAWDSAGDDVPVMDAFTRLRKAGIPKYKLNCYVLIGFEDTPDEAFYRLQTLKDMRIRGFAMRYQPLTAEKINEHVATAWTERELADYTRYWNSQAYLGGIPFEDYHG